MPGDAEKEKCKTVVEKQYHMQKYLPFLDFMIDKIKKKNNEISLECQLSKLQVLRSMVAEKSGRCSWEDLAKVEGVIEKLISKLDFKEQYEKSKEYSANTDNYRTLSGVSSTVTSVSVSQMAADSKVSEMCSAADDLIMKTFKSGESMKKSVDGGKDLLSNSPESSQLLGAPEKSIGTDLDKDLDGFDLTDCPNFSESECNNTKVEPVSAVLDKTSHGDLLSSSREKLLKSLQDKLLLCKPNHVPPKSCVVGKTEKPNESQIISSAFDRSQTSLREVKIDNSVIDNENNSRKTVEITAKSVQFKPSKLCDSSEKNQRDSGSGDINLKQKLKEKFSTDICEVYKVPGKSVGGSLRSLKDSKEYKRNFSVEEEGEEEKEELLKPEKVREELVAKSSCISRSSKSSNSNNNSVVPELKSFQKEESQHEKVCRDFSTSGTEKKREKTDKKSSLSIRSEKREEVNMKQEKNFRKVNNSKSESESSDEMKKLLPKKESESKNLAVNKLNSEELLRFVKGSMQHLPHLSKLAPTELRKAVNSSASGNFSKEEVGSISEISDVSVNDWDELVKTASKTLESKSFESGENTEESPHPFASVKIAPIESNGITKNVKLAVEPSKDTKLLEEVGDKTHNMDDMSGENDPDEEDYAQKLIEDTTPVVATKRKGLLELPLPLMDDLFEDISSIESFETFNYPIEIGNNRKALSSVLERNNKTKSEATTDLLKSASFILNENFTSCPPEANVLCPTPQSRFELSAAPTDPRKNLNKLDQWPNRTAAVASSHAENQFSNRPSNSTADRVVRTTTALCKPNFMPLNKSRPLSHNSSEPKSYVEYKRMKLKEREQLGRIESMSHERPVSNLWSGDNPAVSPAERDDKSKGLPDPRPPRARDTFSKQAKAKGYHPISNPQGDRRKLQHSAHRRLSEHVESRSREESQRREGGGKIHEGTRAKSVDSEELVSPLEELYRDESKPKTGRGYGLQKFKIPKKVREFSIPLNLNSNQNPATNGALSDGVKAHTPVAQNESKSMAKESSRGQTGGVKKSGVENVGPQVRVEQSKTSDGTSDPITSSNVTSDISSKKVVKVYSNKTLTKTEKQVKNPNKNSEVVNTSEVLDCCETEVKIKANEVRGADAKPVLEYDVTNESIELANNELLKTEATQKVIQDAEKAIVPKNGTKVTETLKKCEAQVAECDSSVECSQVNEENTGKKLTLAVGKSTKVSKDEVTQEFVESLIRKSFQSGEGKLLLAHAKLFEKFARKLNSKKLKTIQKIINSETDSSSTEIYSDSDMKKKKNKKSVGKCLKTNKLKKRGRKSRKQKSPSVSSSPSEGEESSEEECERKEAPSESENSARERGEGAAPVRRSKKMKKRRRNREFGKGFSGGRAKRKQRQRKMLEKILNESSQLEAGQETNSSNSCDAPPRECEPKSRRTKGKGKTELDRLHDDIRNMFLSAGEVTQTGQRMCRILRQSGGNIKNLDIVKESAKMVEEEKLKKGTRSSGRKARGSSPGSRSGSQSSDAGSKSTRAEHEEWSDPKLTCVPRVTLQRVDLDNFGYAIRISNDCISFRRMLGRNTAIRGMGSPGMTREKSAGHGLASNVFLLRNKRKVERLRLVKCKHGYVGKKLMDVVQNLPLKMAKMKHLQICEKTEDEMHNRRKCFGKPPKKSGPRRSKSSLEFSNSELLNYAFERIRVMYSCKLCSQVTRYITGHYKVVHPDHEVLISRLCQGEAKRAKLDAKRNRYDNPQEENPLAKSMRRRMKMLLSTSNSYNCRMCSSVKTQDLELFRAHVSSHTGEFRFQCPAEGCNTRTYSRQDIKIHILTKHSKNRTEYNKVAELYTIVVEGGKMFGFLCSVCNFVQLNRNNVVEHVSRQHSASDNCKIIKINMSAFVPRAGRKKHKSAQNEESDCSVLGGEAKVQKLEGSGVTGEIQNKGSEECLTESERSDYGKAEKTQCSEEASSLEGGLQNNESDHRNLSEAKKTNPVEDGDEEEDKELKRSDGISLGGFAVSPLQGNEMDVERGEPVEKNKIGNYVEMEDCDDLGNIGVLQRSDTSAAECQETRKALVRADRENLGPCQKMKVGPLEAQLLENEIVMYECYVKGCLFFTRAYDLFEKHIKISHWRTKWNGICDICGTGKVLLSKTNAENSFKLLTALRHLKLHEREKFSGGKLSTEDLIVELKLVNSTEECNDEDDEEAEKEDSAVESHYETKENEEEAKMSENSETPFPPKPLLRVRNLLGDRLSTPKESSDDTEVVAIHEEPVAEEEPTNSMFTIENVRSLNDAPTEDSEIQIQHVCSLNDSLQPLSQLPPGKTILVRSCPTRKIAIRPEPSSLSIDVGQLSVVQAPAATHPVVLGPLTSSSPIRIISSSLSPMPTFAVKPILVSADPVRMNAPNVLSVISPSLSPVVSNSPLDPESGIAPPPAPSESSPQTAPASKPSLDVTVAPSPPKAASPVSTAPSPVDSETADEKDSFTLQRIHANPNAGNKRVKDAKIYEEMLTKTKLCHLFKCMGIECSFTCNNECVFRQHIGLHEAQRRLNKNKGIRTIFLRLANKTTRAFYWQQCSYCCELLTNTTSALSQHVLEEHGHCMYQCAFCFYRAVSQSYVEIHQNLAHIQILKTTPRVIYKCKPLRTPPSQAAALEKHRRRQSVRPYHCDQCGRKFFITQDFINHLTTQHQSVTAYTCHICKNLCFKADRLVVHYKLHSYCTYQCAYCLHGTETEKEMVFHLCNFHFSQPAVMYVRAFAEGQRQDVDEEQAKSKKHLNNQLESLKVIVYESDTLNADCIVEVDPDEETPESASEASLDLSAIATELGINADAQSSPCVTPLMKELASIGDKNAKNLTVKTLLPNAQFSSESENKAENCSVLISSGLSTPSSEDSSERTMNIPLGQLPLEVVSVQHNESQAPKNVASPDKNLKLNEIIVNLQNKEKTSVALASAEEESKSGAAVSSAVHKLPPVVLSRNSVSKNVYSSRSAIAKKKFEEPEKVGGNREEGGRFKSNGECKDSGKRRENSENAGQGETAEKGTAETDRKSSAESSINSVAEPLLITSVVSLSSGEFEKETTETENSIVIADVCSLSDKAAGSPTSPGILANAQSQEGDANTLKPPVTRTEDFPAVESSKMSTEEKPTEEELETKAEDKKPRSAELVITRSASPDIIILEGEKSKSIITVTLDSDDENDETSKKKPDSTGEAEGGKSSEDVTIRKEMELLRNQIASETDSLLFDESEGDKMKRDLSLNIEPSAENWTPKSLLSPIEEAISSLNKKLQSETERAEKEEVREEGGEKKGDAEGQGKEATKEEEKGDEKKVDKCASEVPERRRTRFATRCRREEGREDGEESRKKESGKCRKMKEGLVGKDLYICGNASCDFAADDDSTLKDHLFVCDFSRETSGMTCPHCARQTKQYNPSAYLDHLKYHGEKKHHCGLCEYSAVDASVSRHVKLKHKCSVLKILPKDSQPGHLCYYPKNYKVDKVDFEVNGYSPGDEDKLPLQSVYQVNVKCAKCPYFTKVRSNMVRHLKIHVKSVETEGVVVVPSTAPTNPVPCLETKERMFDKMTNLAASSQLAQAKEKTAIESLSPEEEAKLPQFVAEQLRYKCCLEDCNYITVDEGMLKHHIKALHDEISYYSCPHCRETVHADVRHVTLDKIGHHLKHHDAKLYKCAHCIYFHYQRNVVEKHTAEKHPDRRYFVHTVREPKPEAPAPAPAPAPHDDDSSNEGGGPRMWKCAVCENFRSPRKATVKDHLLKSHNIKSKYRCKLCPMKANNSNAFCGHFASKHPGDQVSYMKVCLSEKVAAGCLESGNSSGADSSGEHFDTTPLWQRGTPRVRHIRGILIEEEEIKTKKSKKVCLEESEVEAAECAEARDKDLFYCPLCTNKKKPFFTRSEEFFRNHLYQELNYQQFACILCGKMFVDKKDFYRHHARAHRDKAPALKRTKEDHEIKFWVDKVIARRVQQLEERKRKLSSDEEAGGSREPPKKKKESESS